MFPRVDMRYPVFALLLLIAVCAHGEERIRLRYWGNEFDILAWEQIQDFEQLHDGSDGKPAIKIEMGQTASFDRTSDPQRLLCAIAGGDPPDVVWFDRFAVAEWAYRGAFMSLQAFYERDLRERPDDPLTLREDQFFRPCWKEACFEGELFAVPSDADNRALFYNRDMLEKYADELIAAGCSDPGNPESVGPPRTWDQLKAAAEILTERDADGRLIQVGFIPNFGNSWLYMYGWLNGAKFMSADGRTCLLNSREVAEALAYVTEIYDIMGGAEAVSAFQASASGNDIDPFFAERVAMRIDGGALIGVIANNKPDLRFGVALAPAPEGRERLGWSGGWSWVIPEGARHPEAAWTFIRYLASKRAWRIRAEAERRLARASGNVYVPMMSARRDITAWAMEHYVYSNPEINAIYKKAQRIVVDNMPYSKYRPVTPVGQLLWNEHVRAMERGIYHRMDSENTMRNAQLALDRGAQIVQRELDRIYSPRENPEIAWWPIILFYVLAVPLLAGGIIGYYARKMPSRGYFRREYYAGFFFAGPWFFGFLVFGGGPIVFSIFMSLCEYDVFSAPHFLGFGNYIEMFTEDPLFYKSLWNTVFMAFGIPLGMAVSLGIAMLLNQDVKGMAVYRTLFYLPAIMPAVAASILWIWIFNPQQGILNAVLRPFFSPFGAQPPAWLQDPVWAKPALVLMILWGAGAGMIVWLAGLKGIPSHLYEAAAIDGAGPVRRFWNITLPMLSPYILFNLIMGLITTFQIFTQAYIMTHGGPVDATLFYAYALFNNAFRYMRMGYASAMAWILFAIILVLTLIQLRLSKRWVHYESD
jgi:ABC-type sugar transport system permease subunit/ABC-type glycerol-3-phosphate transport system substrate-binding protein